MVCLPKIRLAAFLAALLAGAIFPGCALFERPSHLDKPGQLGATNVLEGVALRAGETVIVNVTTGSTGETSPVPAQEYLINEDGTITLPLIGPVQAAGKTPGQLQDDIHNRYVPLYYVRLTVTVTTQNRSYSVGGEVGHPGPEIYMGQTTLTKAIQAAGDLTEFASHKVWLTRANAKKPVKVNVDKALRDPTKDPPIFPGDKIYVPRRIF